MNKNVSNARSVTGESLSRELFPSLILEMKLLRYWVSSSGVASFCCWQVRIYALYCCWWILYCLCNSDINCITSTQKLPYTSLGYVWSCTEAFLYGCMEWWFRPNAGFSGVSWRACVWIFISYWPWHNLFNLLHMVWIHLKSEEGWSTSSRCKNNCACNCCCYTPVH